MNVDLCVSLHSEILRLGWVGSGRSIDELEAKSSTWFAFYGAEAESLRVVLSDDLVKFLDRALVVGEPSFSFFYYVNGLHHPTNICQMAADLYLFDEEPRKDGRSRCVVLYAMNLFGSHPIGLM